MKKRALITGITGQDGSYLAEFLLDKGYEVHGLIRRSSSFNTQRIDHIYTDPHDPTAALFLHYGDLSDSGATTDLIYSLHPSEIYHLGAQSHVRVSFDLPEYTGNVTGLSTTRMLESLRRSGVSARFYQASSSEIFGLAPPPQNEATPFQPQSPYAAAKAYAFWMVRSYREAFHLFASNGILFNHESPRRGGTFVTRKITQGIAALLAGTQERIYLGNLDTQRDWGFAPEYVEGMWRMLQTDHAEDFVLGTGESHSVREFLQYALEYVGIEVTWQGSGTDEKAVVHSLKRTWSGILKTGQTIVEIDPRYFRPLDVPALRADCTRARQALAWEPKVSFTELVKIMMDHDLMTAGLQTSSEGIDALASHGYVHNHQASMVQTALRQGVRNGGLIG